MPLCAPSRPDATCRRTSRAPTGSWNPYTPAFNSAQVPALSYPVWAQGAALPAGVQWVAPKYREDRLLAMGRWMETRFPVRIAPEQE